MEIVSIWKIEKANNKAYHVDNVNNEVVFLL